MLIDSIRVMDQEPFTPANKVWVKKSLTVFSYDTPENTTNAKNMKR